MKKIILYFLAATAIFIGGLSAWDSLSRRIGAGQPSQAWSKAKQLEYANTLLAKGLQGMAADALEAYIGRGSLDQKELAAVSYKLGTIYMGLRQYEKALGSFYRAEIADKSSPDVAGMNEYIVEALERIGLAQQAQYELESRTKVGGAPRQDDPLVARIGKQEIFQSQINLALDKLPAEVGATYSKGKGKLDFIREYVATEVLYDKARKLGMNRSVKLNDYLEEMRKQLAVQELIQSEMGQSVKISPEDVELFYQAHKDEYGEPEETKVSFVSMDMESGLQEARENLKAGKSAGSGWVSLVAPFIPGIDGQAKEAVELIAKSDNGAIVGPVKISGKLYLFSIDEKKPARPRTFEEVKQVVANDYRMRKQREIIRSLIDKALEQQDVEILYKADEDKDGAVEK